MKSGVFHRKRLSSLVILFLVFLALMSSLVPAQVTTTSTPTEVFGGESQPAPEERYFKEQYSFERKFEMHYDIGPSYEGYDKEQQIFANVFSLIGDDLDPRAVKDFCSEPEKMADIIVSKLKAKFGEVPNVCSQIARTDEACQEKLKESCQQIGKSYVPPGATELEKKQALANACPPNEEALIEACKEGSLEYMRTRLEFLDQVCEDRWVSESRYLQQQCQQQGSFAECNKEKYVQQCLDRFNVRQSDFDKKDERERVCEPFIASVPQCEGGTLEAAYDSFGCQIGYNCKAGTIEVTPTQVCTADYNPVCGKDGFTYSNSCFAKLAKVEIAYSGECRPQCPALSAPTCGANQVIKATYDKNNCVTAYTCETIGTTCPIVSAPACGADQMLKASYDEKGCVKGYECVAEKTMTTTETTATSTTATTDTTTTAKTETTTTTNKTMSNEVTGSVVLTTYDDYINECERTWADQERYCQQLSRSCDKPSFVEQCKVQERENFENFKRQLATDCRINSRVQLKYLQNSCARLDSERQQCLEKSEQQCTQYGISAEACAAVVTEESLRSFIVEEAKKRCKFVDFFEEDEKIKEKPEAEVFVAVLSTASEAELSKLGSIVDELEELLVLPDTIVYKGKINPNDFGNLKLLPFVTNAKLSAFEAAASSREAKLKIVSGEPQKVAANLALLRENDIPEQYLYIIEDKASDIVDVSDDLEDFGEKEAGKDFGYKFRRFLGLVKEAEEREIAELERSQESLQKSIDALEALIDQVPDNISKAVLKEQVEALKAQRAALEQLIKDKKSGAKGLIRLFGLFG